MNFIAELKRRNVIRDVAFVVGLLGPMLDLSPKMGLNF